MGRIRKCKVCGQCSRNVNDLWICDGCKDKPKDLINPVLDEHATAIRSLGKRMFDDVIEIGRRLAECKAILKQERGWLAWIDREFGWARNTAENFINVYEGSKVSNFDTLDVPVSSLYLLAGPSTPKAAIDEVIKRSEGGERLSGQDVKETIQKHKPTVVPMPPSALDGVLQLIADNQSGCYGKNDEPVISRVVQAATKEQLEAIVGSPRFGGAYKSAATKRLAAIQQSETRTIEYEAHDVPTREVTAVGYASDPDPASARETVIPPPQMARGQFVVTQKQTVRARGRYADEPPPPVVQLPGPEPVTELNAKLNGTVRHYVSQFKNLLETAKGEIGADELPTLLAALRGVLDDASTLH